MPRTLSITQGAGSGRGGGGAAAKPRVKMYLMPGQFVNPVDTTILSQAVAAATTNGDGGASMQNDGFRVQSGTSNTSYACLQLKATSMANADYGWWGNIFDRSYSLVIIASMYITATNNTFFIGNNSTTAIPGSGNKHVGFKCVTTGGGATQTWYAVCGNGTTATSVDITTAVTGALAYEVGGTSAQHNFCIEYTPTSIEYYFNGVLCATLTTHIPSGAPSASRNSTLQAFMRGDGTDNAFLHIQYFVMEADAY